MKIRERKRTVWARISAFVLTFALAAAVLGVSTPGDSVGAAAKAGVYVEKNAAVDADFITGVDISSYIAERDSGVVYYDFDGNKLDDAGFFAFLKKCGVNYIRVRVWNDPSDNGRKFGGGNCDLDNAIQLGKYAKAAGIKMMVDFHLSDFWADPSTVQPPRAWQDMDSAKKAAAAKAYITQSLNALKAAGADVGMVQVGNETDTGVAGEREPADYCAILKAGAEGVRAADPAILVAIHYANASEEPLAYAANLKKYGVDYDVFAMSYYRFWHGSLANLENVMKSVADKYGKKVMVAENYWPYTLDDGDGYENILRDGAWGLEEVWPYSAQGQVTEIASVIQAVTNVGDAGIGFMYWEPAWIPVQYAYDADGNLIDRVRSSNQEKWEKYGSGCAASAANSYTGGKFAGEEAAGSEVDNVAWFDFNGHPLETMNVFRYIRTGTNVSATVGKLKYQLTQSRDKEGNYSLTAVVAGADQSLKKAVIPQTVKIGGVSYKVTAIAENAFSGNRKITEVTIPKSVKKIGKSAFQNASGLKKLTVKTTALTGSSVGAKAFSGTAKTLKVTVPGAKVSAYKKLFTGRGMHKNAVITK